MEMRCPVPILCMCQWGGCPCVCLPFWGKIDPYKCSHSTRFFLCMLASMMTPRKMRTFQVLNDLQMWSSRHSTFYGSTRFGVSTFSLSVTSVERVRLCCCPLQRGPCCCPLFGARGRCTGATFGVCIISPGVSIHLV